MKTEDEVRAAIEEINADERFRYPLALVSINAPTIATVTATWPDWAQHLALLMGKVGAYEIIYRNQDLREFVEARRPDFAAWAKDRDMIVGIDADDRKADAYGVEGGRFAPDAEASEYAATYVRCLDCGSKILDPVIRIDRGQP